MSHLPVKRAQSLSERFYPSNDTFPVKAPVDALQRTSDAFTGVFEVGQLFAALKKIFLSQSPLTKIKSKIGYMPIKRVQSLSNAFYPYRR